MIDNGGKRLTPTLIDRIQDRNGKTIFRADNRPCEGCAGIEWNHQQAPTLPDNREHIADPLATFQLVEMMQGVVQRGTGAAVKAVGKPIAGKTGTTSDWTDAWFVGFSPDLTAGVFVGYDDSATLGNGEQAAVVAAPIFRDFMIAALKDVPAKEFRTPPGLRMYRVNPSTGLPAGTGEPAIWEGYQPGTEPGKDRNRGLQPIPGQDLTAQGDPVLGAGQHLPLPATPTSGTGGLY
jgi:penicillin-binding protein 1A